MYLSLASTCLFSGRKLHPSRIELYVLLSSGVSTWILIPLPISRDRQLISMRSDFWISILYIYVYNVHINRTANYKCYFHSYYVGLDWFRVCVCVHVCIYYIFYVICECELNSTGFLREFCTVVIYYICVSECVYLCFTCFYVDWLKCFFLDLTIRRNSILHGRARDTRRTLSPTPAEMLGDIGDGAIK